MFAGLNLCVTIWSSDSEQCWIHTVGDMQMGDILKYADRWYATRKTISSSPVVSRLEVISKRVNMLTALLLQCANTGNS